MNVELSSASKLIGKKYPELQPVITRLEKNNITFRFVFTGSAFKIYALTTDGHLKEVPLHNHYCEGIRRLD